MLESGYCRTRKEREIVIRKFPSNRLVIRMKDSGRGTCDMARARICPPLGKE